MSEKSNEIFCFIENYIGGSSQVNENHHPNKLMLNNINKFSISEDDAFDISGIVHLESLSGKTRGLKIRKKRQKSKKRKDRQLLQIENHSQRKEALKCLSTATGNVHVFIFGMNLYVESNEKDESYIDLKMMMNEILSVIRKTNAEFLQVSFSELRVSSGTSPSMGMRIDQFQVRELYRQKTATLSFNNQLDEFYEKSQSRNIRCDVCYFFLAELLRQKELETYKRRFNEIEQCRMERKGTRVETKSKHEKILQESQYKEYRLFTGFRATLSFPVTLYSGNQDDKILELIYKNLESKLAYSIIWKWKFSKDLTKTNSKK